MNGVDDGRPPGPSDPRAGRSNGRSPAGSRPGLIEVADGVFGYVQPDGGWCLNNAGVVVTDAGTLVIDTAATESRARRLREAVRTLSASPPRLVVNTHHHSDHTFGNFVFAPDATILAQERCRTEMIASRYGLCGLFPDVEWGDIELVYPTVTYREGLTLHLGDVRVELIHPAAPAHTGNDTLVWLPGARVLFAGDVLMCGVTPFCLMGSVDGSIAVIERLRALRPATVVCGHGRIAGPEVFDENEAYLRRVQWLAADGIAGGRSPLEVARSAGLGEFAGLLDAERLVPNLRRAYADSLGTEPDLVAALAEMVEFHGRPLRSRA